jgi:serine/threonine-protein kinase
MLTADVFISYKAEDRARLAPLVAALEAEGFSIWWDARIGGGANWREEIQQHLDLAKCVVVAWTKRSVGPAGNFVRDEATRAQRRGVYLPVQLDAVELPLGFGEVQALPLRGWKGDRGDPRFKAVADAVRTLVTAERRPYRSTPSGQGHVSRRAMMAGGVGAVALAGVGGWVLLKPASANAKRIAVLPFANLSSDQEQAYFSEGVAEELRAALSRVGLEVIGRTSSEAVKAMDAEAAASKLRVGNILTGSVRRSPEMIRVNAQLVSGADGVQRWGQSYDRAPGDAIKIQSDIASNVAQALSVTLGQATRAALKLGGTADSVAQDLILKARQLRREADGPETLRKSISFADGAIERDAHYADAYVAKADALTALGSNYPSSAADYVEQFQLGEIAAKKALEIAPKLGSAHISLAGIESNRLNFRTALQYTRRALALAQDDPFVLALAVPNIVYLEEEQEALRLADRLIAVDPLNSRSYRWKAEALFSLRHYHEAIVAGRKTLELAPDLRNAHLWIAYALIVLGRYGEAGTELSGLPGDDPFRLTAQGFIAARSHGRPAAQRHIAQMRQLLGDVWSYQYAQIHAQAGDNDAAFAELETALQASDPGLIYVKRDPFLDPIRKDARYATLVRKLAFA